jgi:hypothetical protein
VVPQGLFELFSVFLFGVFRSLFLAIFFERFRGLSFGDLVGIHPLALCGSFPFDFPPKSVSRGAQFWGFRCPRVCGALGGNPLIPLDSTSFGGPKLVYGVPMRCSYYPQSLLRIRGVNWEIGSWIWGS